MFQFHIGYTIHAGSQILKFRRRDVTGTELV